MRSSLLLTSLALALPVAGGCAPSNPGLVIDGVIPPPSGGMCLYDASATVFLLSGVLDTLDVGAPFGPRYVAYLRIANHLINNFRGTYPLRADPNVMTIIAADIEITNIDGSVTSFPGLPNPFRVAATGMVPSAASESAGLGVSAIEVLPAQYVAAGTAAGSLPDGARVIASIRVIGRTSGDAALQSGEFLFPIDVCMNCLYACATDAADAGSGCSPGQDQLTIFAPGTGGCP